MAQADFGTGKTLAVLAIVLGCFAVLWPKIFYPMWQTAFALTSPNMNTDEARFREFRDGAGSRPSHIHPGMGASMNSEATPENIHDKFMMREGKPFPHPTSRQPVKPQPKSGGAMGIIMPIYTVGIIVFFLYTVLKLVFKKNEDDKKPLIKDFQMDPEYHKFIFDQNDDLKKPPSKAGKRGAKKKANLCNTTIPESDNELEAEEIDAKDYEIYKLKKKLEETEKTMERIIQHMGTVTASLNKDSLMEKLTPRAAADTPRLRNRRKGKSKRSESARKWQAAEEPEEMDVEPKFCGKTKTQLEEDLSDIFRMCSATEASIKSLDTSPSDPIEHDLDESTEEDMDESEEESEDDYLEGSDEKDSLLEDTKSEAKRKVACS